MVWLFVEFGGAARVLLDIDTARRFVWVRDGIYPEDIDLIDSCL